MRFSCRFLPGFLVLFPLIVGFALLGTNAYAQTAQLSGAIKDSAGAAIPQAAVTVVEQNTGETRGSVSNSDGLYSVLALKPGAYSIKVTASGFETVLQNGVIVHVGEDVHLDFVVRVGRVQETIQVSSEVPLLSTSTSGSESNITPQQIIQMPINGRNYLDLMQLVPGVTINRQRDEGTDASVPVLGERGGNTIFLIDGMLNRDEANGGSAANFNQETIAEFQVITTGYKAEYGHGSGGIVNVVTHSGSNEWHGVASAFHRNNAFDSSDTSNSSPPLLVRWDPSLTLGGPLIKDRLFLFSSIEYIHEDRALNFIFPPNTPQAVQDFENSFNQPSTDRETRGFTKLDALLGRHRLSVEMNLTNGHIANFLPLSEATSLPSTRTNIGARHLLIGATDTALFGDESNPWVLTLRGFYRGEPTFTGPAHANAGPSTDFYMFSGYNTGDLAGDLGSVQFGAPLTAGEFNQKYGDFTANLAKEFGRHSIKFGAEYTREQADGTENSRQYNILLATLNDFTEFGPINSGFFSLQTDAGLTPQANQIHIRNNYIGSYVQDDWKIAPRVVLNLGLRWDYDSEFDAKRNFSPRVGISWAVTPKTVIRANAGIYYDHFRLGLARDIPGFGGAAIVHTQTASFPRLFYGNPSIFPDLLLGICFSRTLTDAQVAAMGLTCPYGAVPYYGIDHLSNIVATGHSPIPDNAVVNVSNIQALSGLSPQQYANEASLALGQKPGYLFWGPYGTLSLTAFGQFQNTITIDPNFATPFTRSYTGGVQHQFGDDWAVSADYYYKQIRNMLGARQTNIPFDARMPGNTFDGTPDISFGPWFSGTYQAVIIAARKRVSHRFSFGGSYTYAHETDDQVCTTLGGENSPGFAATACLPSDSFVGMTTLVTDPATGQTNAKGSFIASNGNYVPKAGIFYIGPSLDHGPSDFSVPQTLEAHGLVQLPWNFEISGIFRVQSGFAYSKQLQVPVDQDGNDDFTSTDFFSGRNHYRAAIFANTDMRFSKTIRIKEKVSLQAFFEFFNLFNRANPAAVQTLPGQTTPVGQPLQVLPGREGQIGARIDF
jgi:Carboxypeptidase regulatory-like domain/TonB dependent receptor/TonB-dependent Receptor Plug Domain